jgi:hypothetical protein
MTIQEAAKNLSETLRPFPWFEAVGYDAPHNTRLHVYVKEIPPRMPPLKEYEGWPVVIHETGGIQLLGSAE